MSTQSRDGRSAPTTTTGHGNLRYGSRVASGDDRAFRSEQADAMWNFPAYASGRTAMAARCTLLKDCRNQQYVRSFSVGSPPCRQAAALRPRFNGDPPISFPAVFAPSSAPCRMCRLL
jgi:hypothetical protein